MKTSIIKVLRQALSDAQGRVRLIEAALNALEEKPKRSHLNAAARRRIALAQKKRWRKWHKERKR